MTCALRRGAGDGHDVVAVGGVDDHVVGRGVVAAAGRGEVRRHVDEVGAGQVVDGEVVGAAERVDVDRLDVVEVHDDVARCCG